MTAIAMKLKPTKAGIMACGVLPSSLVSGSLHTFVHGILVSYLCSIISLTDRGVLQSTVIMQLIPEHYKCPSV